MKQIKGIWLPDSDDHFQGHLEQNPEYQGKGTYQFKKIEAALRVVPDNRRGVALDVGAHVGLWTRVLAYEFERVVAIEPVPAHLECLYLNVMEHAASVKVIEAVAAEKDGQKVSIVAEAGNTGNSRVCDPRLATHAAQSVTVDSLKLETLDFMKVDVEGYEIYVLKGAEQTILREKPVIVVEQKQAAYGNDRFAAVELLSSWGAVKLWEKAGDVCMGWD